MSFTAHHGRPRAARAYNILECVASWARVDSVLVELKRRSTTAKRRPRQVFRRKAQMFFFMVGRGDGSTLTLNVKLPPAARLRGMGGGALAPEG